MIDMLGNVRTDAKGRVSLGKFFDRKISSFEVTKDKYGRLILDPHIEFSLSMLKKKNSEAKKRVSKTKEKIPNKETLQAMKDSDERKNLLKCDSIEELFRECLGE